MLILYSAIYQRIISPFVQDKLIPYVYTNTGEVQLINSFWRTGFVSKDTNPILIAVYEFESINKKIKKSYEFAVENLNISSVMPVLFVPQNQVLSTERSNRLADMLSALKRHEISNPFINFVIESKKSEVKNFPAIFNKQHSSFIIPDFQKKRSESDLVLPALFGLFIFGCCSTLLHISFSGRTFMFFLYSYLAILIVMLTVEFWLPYQEKIIKYFDPTGNHTLLKFFKASEATAKLLDAEIRLERAMDPLDKTSMKIIHLGVKNSDHNSVISILFPPEESVLNKSKEELEHIFRIHLNKTLDKLTDQELKKIFKYIHSSGLFIEKTRNIDEIFIAELKKRSLLSEVFE